MCVGKQMAEPLTITPYFLPV